MVKDSTPKEMNTEAIITKVGREGLNTILLGLREATNSVEIREIKSLITPRLWEGIGVNMKVW